MNRFIISCCLIIGSVNTAFTQAPPPNVFQLSPYLLNQLNKDVIVTDININGDVTGWIENEVATPQGLPV